VEGYYLSALIEIENDYLACGLGCGEEGDLGCVEGGI
jgi:hypothetical protein